MNTQLESQEWLKVEGEEVLVTDSEMRGDTLIVRGNQNVNLKNTKAESQEWMRVEGEEVVAADSEMRGDTLIVRGNQRVNFKNTKVESTREHTCNTELNDQWSDLFYCVKKSQIDRTFNQSDFLTAFNVQYRRNNPVNEVNETYPYIEKNFTAYFLSFNRLELSSTTILAPRVSFCTTDLFLQQSVVDSSGRGCPIG